MALVGAVELPLWGSPDVFGLGQEVVVDLSFGGTPRESRGTVVGVYGPEINRRYRVQDETGFWRVLHARFLRAV